MRNPTFFSVGFFMLIGEKTDTQVGVYLPAPVWVASLQWPLACDA